MFKKQKVSYSLFNLFEKIQDRSSSNGQVERMCVHVRWNIVMNKTFVGGTIISALCRVNFMTTGWVGMRITLWWFSIAFAFTIIARGSVVEVGLVMN